MARAKRTARAEARRRYRAEHPQEVDGLDDADDMAELDDGRPTPRADRPSDPGRPSRGGGLRAFREAYQPADFRGDLRTLPALLTSRAVTIPTPANLVHIVLEGGFPPVTAGNPRPYGMPPFATVLSNDEVAQLLTHIRNSWGNTGAPVTAFEVTRYRAVAPR